MEELLTYLKLIPLEFVWLGFSLLFLTIEILTPGLFYCLSFAAGSSAAAVAAYFASPLELQCGIALAISCGSFFILYKFVKEQRLSKVHFEKPNTNIDALIGQHATVIDAVAPEIRGTVKIRGELWSAATHEAKTFAPGTTIVIISVQGNTLYIRSISSFV